ncbi:hypothetical protein BDV93DRAFT_253990 [Ceratobasidium sp. AG-I]|nr:hypothetical protein BDV93DRAFT_253990 [Ceratobasidium sp. AG-I]
MKTRTPSANFAICYSFSPNHKIFSTCLTSTLSFFFTYAQLLAWNVNSVVSDTGDRCAETQTASLQVYLWFMFSCDMGDVSVARVCN